MKKWLLTFVFCLFTSVSWGQSLCGAIITPTNDINGWNIASNDFSVLGNLLLGSCQAPALSTQQLTLPNSFLSSQGYVDVVEIATPANPAVGKERWYGSLSSHVIACINSGGTSCLTGGGSSVLFKTNGTSNGSQSIFNAKAGTNITIADDGVGGITFSAAASLLALKTNGVANGSQAILNLKAGSNITATDDGVGGITLAAGVGTGLPASINYIAPGASSATIQTALSAATAGTQVWFAGPTYAACSLTLTAAGVTLVGLNEAGSVLQCATPNVPVLTVSGQGDQVINLTLQHITSSPTCPGGDLTSTCGDGLQVLGGTNRVKIENVHTNFNYYGMDLGWTTYSEVDRSISEFNNADGVHFKPDATNKTMQWEMRSTMSEQNLSNGFNLTYPASFINVQGTAPHFSGWTQTYCNGGYGFNFSASAATTSGIADVWMNGVFASQNNNSGIRLDLGPSGGRNAIISSVYSEQSGTCTAGAGFSRAALTATNAGYGIEITSSCDGTVAPVITGGNLWSNSYSGLITACPETSIANVSTRGNGAAAASAQTEAGFTINATNVSITGGNQDAGGAQVSAYYILGGDTPSISGFTTDFATPIVVGAQPTNGFLDFQGNIGIYKNMGVPSAGLCTSARNGWKYYRTDTGNFSTDYTCKNAVWGAIN